MAMYSLCRIYERIIDPPETNLTPESNLWLGQRNRKHGFFKVSRSEMPLQEGNESTVSKTVLIRCLPLLKAGL